MAALSLKSLDVITPLQQHYFSPTYLGPCQTATMELFVKIFQNQPPVFNKKGVLKNFAVFAGIHLCWSLFLIELQALALQLYKIRPQQMFS